MYFESREHTRKNVSGAVEAATLIHNGNAATHEAIAWETPIGTLCAVNDDHIDGFWGEVAVINLSTNEKIESITFAWVETLDEKIKHLEDCGTGAFKIGTIVTVPMDGAGQDALAWFECSCCGTGFKSTINKQKKYDQDAGYGRCSARCGLY